MNVLFEAEQRDLAPLEVLKERLQTPGVDSPLPQYAIDIVEGYVAVHDRVDELLETYSHGWTLARMPSVDRALLRIGAWELIYNDDVPDVVSIDEAVELARDLSTDESPAFVNGLLARLLEVKPTLVD